MFNSLKDDINDLQIEVRELSDLVFNTVSKINDLFVRDSHKTLRPKTDLLNDEFDEFEEDVWNHFRMLQERIEKLEKSELWNQLGILKDRVEKLEKTEVDYSEKTER